MKRPFLTFAMLCVLLPAVGEDLRVDSVRLLGPFSIQQPMLVDSVDAAQKRYAREQLLDTPLSTDSLWKTAGKAIAEAPRSADSTSVELCLAGFEFDVRGVAKLKVEAEGPSQRKVFVDGVEVTSAIRSAEVTANVSRVAIYEVALSSEGAILEIIEYV